MKLFIFIFLISSISAFANNGYELKVRKKIQNKDGSVTLKGIRLKISTFDSQNFEYANEDSLRSLCRWIGFDDADLFEGLNEAKKSYGMKVKISSNGTISVDNEAVYKISKLTCVNIGATRTIITFNKNGYPNKYSYIYNIKYSRGDKVYDVAVDDESDYVRVCKMLGYGKFHSGSGHLSVVDKEGPKVKFGPIQSMARSVNTLQKIDKITCY